MRYAHPRGIIVFEITVPGDLFLGEKPFFNIRDKLAVIFEMLCNIRRTVAERFFAADFLCKCGHGEHLALVFDLRFAVYRASHPLVIGVFERCADGYLSIFKGIIF